MPNYDSRPVFYVYILFDAFGIPRWVGKGQNKRIYESIKISRDNIEKNQFIKETRFRLQDVPRVKIQEHLTELEAFELEQLLITAIGRAPEGPLTNKSGGYTDHNFINRWWEDLNEEERTIFAQNLSHSYWDKLTAEERSERARGTALKMHANRTPEQVEQTSAKRSATMKQKGIRPPKHEDLPLATRKRMGKAVSKKALARWASMTPERRAEIGRRIAEGQKRKKEAAEAANNQEVLQPTAPAAVPDEKPKNQKQPERGSQLRYRPSSDL